MKKSLLFLTAFLFCSTAHAETIKHTYLAETDEVQKEVTNTIKVNVPFIQFENELANLKTEREILDAKIAELENVIALKG